jgi:hypothetical protein
MKPDKAALAETVRKMRKLRLLDHVAIKDTAPPAVTFLAVMQSGLGGAFEDAAIDYVIEHAIKYYLAAQFTAGKHDD